MKGPLGVVVNIVWLVVAGWSLLVAWWLAAALVCLTIVGIPFGVQLFRIGLYAAWPFGRTTVQQGGAVSGVGNVLWIVLVGWWLAAVHIVSAVLLAITLVGIPAAIVDLKLVPIAFAPFGRRVVPT